MNTKSETHISTNGLYYVYASYTITDRTISQSAVKRNGVARTISLVCILTRR